MTPSTSFPKDKIKILLLGGIHPSATEGFKKAGYRSVESLKGEMTEEELLEKISNVHILGIRSATRVTKKILERAGKLLTIGCFCIGTNQVELVDAKKRGIAVFNAPFSNTRSVAELVLAEVVMLLRGIPAKNNAVHSGLWPKSAKNAYEVRGKTIGIVGYGHIGTQVGILAEAFGMHVLYFDIVSQLSIGNAKPATSLKALLSQSDVVTLHVPGGAQTKNLIGKKEIKMMKKGASLINASRGHVVDIDALKKALSSGHLTGAAIDVYPSEPTASGEHFSSPLQGIENVILTPHIAGSTMEAQERIGAEVSEKLVEYLDTGSTMGSVNFLPVSLPSYAKKHRILHIHKNEPGILAAINKIFAAAEVNISGQFLQTDPDIGYVVTDIDQKYGQHLISKLKTIPGTIKTRILY